MGEPSFTVGIPLKTASVSERRLSHASFPAVKEPVIELLRFNDGGLRSMECGQGVACPHGQPTVGQH
jgi:hypothetical protein